jgi:hypothetical protein
MDREDAIPTGSVGPRGAGAAAKQVIFSSVRRLGRPC